MLFKKKEISFGANDIVQEREILNHLELLRQSNTKLRCALDPQRFSFRLVELNLEMKEILLFAEGDFPRLVSGEIITFGYVLKNGRYRFGQRIYKVNEKDQTLLIPFPLVIHFDERRKLKRITLPPSQEIYTSIISDLTGGFGVAGNMLNLTIAGGAFRAEKMVSIAGQKEIKLSREMVKTGPVALIRFKLPTGQVEGSGKIIHTYPEGGIFRVGFNLVIDKAVERFIEGYLSRF